MSVTLTNEGDVAADQVVQLYIRDSVSSVTRRVTLSIANDAVAF